MKRKNNQLKIYIAGPFGFSESGRYFYYNKLIPEIENLGLLYFDPWKTSLSKKINSLTSLNYGVRKKKQLQKLDMEIGQLNKLNIDGCDIVLAILDGTDVDSGTAAEIGYAFARNKKIIGYRGDSRLSADNEGCTVNLQVEFFIRSSGGIIVHDTDELVKCLKNFIN